MTKKQQAARKQKAEASRRNMLIGALAAGAVIIVVIIFALLNQGAQPALASEISIQQAYDLYQQGDVFFLDVREQSEWDEYHAPNSTLIPLGELPSRLNEVPKDKEIVVVCRSGNRSQSGRDILKGAGFENVTSMAGGLSSWRSAGYPVAP